MMDREKKNGGGKRVLVLTPRCRDRTGGVQTYSRTLLEALENHPAVDRVCCLEWEGRPPGRGLKYLWFIGTHLFRAWLYRPHVVIATHLHMAKLFVLFCPGVRERWTVLHGVECWKPGGCFNRFGLFLSTRLLPVSRYTLDQVACWYPRARGKATVFPNHLQEIPDFVIHPSSARAQLRWPEDKLIFITVARLEPSERPKGIPDLLRALSVLPDPADRIRYYVIGEGTDRGTLEGMAREQGVGDKVEFLGRLSDADLNRAYQACDGLLMPSSKEGFGLVFVEALARGRPVLAGQADGSVDATLGGELGILVEPGDVESIRDGWAELIEGIDGNDSRIAPERLRDKTLEAFGPERMQERLQALFGGDFS